MKKIILLTALLLVTKVCVADDTITTARKTITIKDGSTLQRDSFWVGAIKNLKDVTFVNWNFSRKTPHTEVFVNCSNLTFVDCNLVNVELQADFKVRDSLTIHRREYDMLGRHYVEIECGDGKTRLYEEATTEVDVIERDFKNLPTKDKDKIKQKYQDSNIPVIEKTFNEELISIEDTPNDKKIKAINIDR